MSLPNNTQRALVLGGGGFVASSWITGLITGMAEAGIDVRDADLLIGTSSGARVALQLASAAPLEEVFARQAGAARHFGAAPQAGRQPGAMDMRQVQQEVAQAKALGGSREDILRRYGQLALTLAGPEPQARTQLPVEDWPERRVQLIALNAETGVRRAFDRASGIDLADALRATTASFGAAPVWFEGQPYIDGGYYSSDNADLAADTMLAGGQIIAGSQGGACCWAPWNGKSWGMVAVGTELHMWFTIGRPRAQHQVSPRFKDSPIRRVQNRHRRRRVGRRDVAEGWSYRRDDQLL